MMKSIPPVLLTLLFFPVYIQSQTQMAQERVLFFQTNWGNTLSWDLFCERTKASGYDGIEIWLPSGGEEQEQLRTALKKHGLLVAFLNGTDKSIPFEQSLRKYTDNLKVLLSWKPAFINCHTGSEFYSLEQNKAFIDSANHLGLKRNIPVYHETHRGRFSFSLSGTKEYVKSIPALKLNLDISHWMVVHESLLEDKDAALAEILDRTQHIHARIGHAEGPQVNDPEAPEWREALNRHLGIWEKVIRQKWRDNQKVFTITTEFGPPHYQPTVPYTQMPLSDQWKANVFMMKVIKERLGLD